MHIKITSHTRITRVYEHHDPSTGNHVVDVMGDNLTVEEVEVINPDNTLPESRDKVIRKPGEEAPEQLPVETRTRRLTPDNTLPEPGAGKPAHPIFTPPPVKPDIKPPFTPPVFTPPNKPDNSLPENPEPKDK